MIGIILTWCIITYIIGGFCIGLFSYILHSQTGKLDFSDIMIGLIIFIFSPIILTVVFLVSTIMGIIRLVNTASKSKITIR